MPSRSTTTNLLCCDTKIARLLNIKSSCDVILLDFARAFDKVPHDVLSDKLQAIGVEGKLHAWLMDFLSGRSQYVSYQNVSSAFTSVSSGVIQGSVLGPLLFNIFINDLPSVVKSSSVWLFADDVKLVGEASTDTQCDNLQHDLEAVWAWSEKARLPLCLPKCQCLHIGSKNCNRLYNINSTQLTVVDKCVDLGVTRTCDCTYDEHVHMVIAKASRAAGMIFRMFSTRSMLFLANLFNAYVLPILEYASPVWNPAGVSLTNEIERVLRRFTKRLPALRALSYEARFERLGMCSLQDRRQLADVIIAFKALHGHVNILPDDIGIKLSELSICVVGAAT